MQQSDAARWGEGESLAFLDYGDLFVPERERQIATMVDLVPAGEEPVELLELCCGEGLLAAALLARYPQSTVHGFDGSETMLARAAARTAPYGARFRPKPFDLTARDWREPAPRYRAILSSLAIHHLDGAGKRALFADLYQMLEPGGRLIIADVVAPATEEGRRQWAEQWDEDVRAADPTGAAFEAFERERWNMYRHGDEDEMDHPSPLFDQLRWLAEAGFIDVEVHWLLAGHAIFSACRGA